MTPHVSDINCVNFETAGNGHETAGLLLADYGSSCYEPGRLLCDGTPIEYCAQKPTEVRSQIIIPIGARN